MKTHEYNESVNHELNATVSCEATSTSLSIFQLVYQQQERYVAENMIGQAKTQILPNAVSRKQGVKLL
jgi:hypothetical protein